MDNDTDSLNVLGFEKVNTRDEAAAGERMEEIMENTEEDNRVVVQAEYVEDDKDKDEHEDEDHNLQQVASDDRRVSCK